MSGDGSLRFSGSAASSEECACGHELVVCRGCGDSRCLACDPYEGGS